MVTVFWDAHGVVLIDYMENGKITQRYWNNWKKTIQTKGAYVAKIILTTKSDVASQVLEF